MKFFGRILCFCLALGILCGCTITRENKAFLYGGSEMGRTNHTLHVWASIEYPSQAYYRGPRPKNFYQNSVQENSFVVNIAGKGIPVFFGSIEGDYQFNTEKVQPLDLVYLNKSNAVFIPRTHSVHGGMDTGQYKLDFNYVLDDGETNSCQFDLKYEIKPKTHVYSWLGLWLAFHGGGGP